MQKAVFLMAAQLSFCHLSNRPLVFPTWFDRNRAVQSLNIARDLKFWIQEEGYYHGQETRDH